MARWAFFDKRDPNKEIGESYDADGAEKKRRDLMEIHGQQLVVKIDGKPYPGTTALK